MAEKEEKKKKKAPRAKSFGKKGRSRMPTKRSINLVLVDENKINWITAVPALLAILALAGLFGKFLVADRLVAVSAATARASRLQASVNEAMAAIEQFGDIEDTYAHYTYADMTATEQSLVDRVLILDLIQQVFPTAVEEEIPDAEEAAEEEEDWDEDAWDEDAWDEEESPDEGEAAAQAQDHDEHVSATAWSVSENVLTVEVTGATLERMNQLARQIEAFPIVDSCTISTADKGNSKASAAGVKAKFLVYLQQPPKEVAEP